MHIDSSFLGLIFRFTLFTLLVFKLYQLVKAYVIPYLSQQVKELAKQQMELLEKETLLASTLKRVDNQIAQQKKMAILLEKKVQIWYQVMSERKLEDEKDRKFHLLRVIEKRKLQEQQLSEAKMVVEVIPFAVKLAQEELASTYQGERGITLLKSFIEHLDMSQEQKQV